MVPMPMPPHLGAHARAVGSNALSSSMTLLIALLEHVSAALQFTAKLSRPTSTTTEKEIAHFWYCFCSSAGSHQSSLMPCIAQLHEGCGAGIK
jgi:hypothetical protein